MSLRHAGDEADVSDPVRQQVVDAFARSASGEFTHGSTHSGNAMSCFIGLQVYKYMQEHNLFTRLTRPAQIGGYLHERLAELADKHAIVGDTRGRGLLAGMVDSRAGIVAANGASSGQAVTMVPVGTIRTFLQAQRVAPPPAASGPINQSVLRVICVRK